MDPVPPPLPPRLPTAQTQTRRWPAIVVWILIVLMSLAFIGVAIVQSRWIASLLPPEDSQIAFFVFLSMFLVVGFGSATFFALIVGLVGRQWFAAGITFAGLLTMFTVVSVTLWLDQRFQDDFTEGFRQAGAEESEAELEWDPLFANCEMTDIFAYATDEELSDATSDRIRKSTQSDAAKKTATLPAPWRVVIDVQTAADYLWADECEQFFDHEQPMHTLPASYSTIGLDNAATVATSLLGLLPKGHAELKEVTVDQRELAWAAICREKPGQVQALFQQLVELADYESQLYERLGPFIRSNPDAFSKVYCQPNLRLPNTEDKWKTEDCIPSDPDPPPSLTRFLDAIDDEYLARTLIRRIYGNDEWNPNAERPVAWRNVLLVDYASTFLNDGDFDYVFEDVWQLSRLPDALRSVGLEQPADAVERVFSLFPAGYIDLDGVTPQQRSEYWRDKIKSLHEVKIAECADTLVESEIYGEAFDKRLADHIREHREDFESLFPIRKPDATSPSTP